LGDSITQGSEYPTYLQLQLGDEYAVQGFGLSGSTVVLTSDRPYLYQTVCQQAQDFQPNFVTILLGTNDARNNIYRDDIATFSEDYKTLISTFQALPSHPQVWLVTPPPAFDNTLDVNATYVVEGVIPRIRQVAADMNLTLVDIYTPLLQHPEFFPDGVHPNNEGALAIADEIYRALTNG
jgi:lysophospholipase L1-like esterase